MEQHSKLGLQCKQIRTCHVGNKDHRGVAQAALRRNAVEPLSYFVGAAESGHSENSADFLVYHCRPSEDSGASLAERRQQSAVNKLNDDAPEYFVGFELFVEPPPQRGVL